MFYTYAMSKTTDWVIDEMNKEETMVCGVCGRKHVARRVPIGASSNYLCEECLNKEETMKLPNHYPYQELRDIANENYNPLSKDALETMRKAAHPQTKEDSMKLTACGKCKFILKMPGVWKEFNDGLRCKAMPKQGVFNCFTGEYEHKTYWLCNDINNGRCPHFESEPIFKEES